MTKRGSTSGTRLRAVNIALALAIVLLPAVVAEARTYKVLYNFTGGSDGGYPVYGSLVLDEAVNLYGTTDYGGTNYCGTVFQVTPSGTENVLYNFTCGADGGYADSSVVLSGNTLYGTTYSGGSGYGVVFAVNIKAMTETVLYTFTGGSDGGYPYSGVILKNGILYGTTSSGGSSSHGVVYSVVVETGKETVLHTFAGSDGDDPFGGNLTLDKTGKILYGTTAYGGSYGYGVVFSLTIKNAKYKVLHHFKGRADGLSPVGTMTLDTAGNLYGTTMGSTGSSGYYGTVFRVVPTGKETVLYSFTGGADGGSPYGGVLWTRKGLYGTTSDYGTSGYYGVIFKVVKTTETVLHSFGYSDGASPFCAVIMDAKGNIYGTTETGGSADYGTVWELTP